MDKITHTTSLLDDEIKEIHTQELELSRSRMNLIKKKRKKELEELKEKFKDVEYIVQKETKHNKTIKYRKIKNIGLSKRGEILIADIVEEITIILFDKPEYGIKNFEISVKDELYYCGRVNNNIVFSNDIKIINKEIFDHQKQLAIDTINLLENNNFKIQ